MTHYVHFPNKLGHRSMGKSTHSAPPHPGFFHFFFFLSFTVWLSAQVSPGLALNQVWFMGSVWCSKSVRKRSSPVFVNSLTISNLFIPGKGISPRALSLSPLSSLFKHVLHWSTKSPFLSTRCTSMSPSYKSVGRYLFFPYFFFFTSSSPSLFPPPSLSPSLSRWNLLPNPAEMCPDQRNW